MGVSKEQAMRNRQAIIETASRVFRERGVDGVGVADLMKAAGFTHGGFYNHFESKDALAAEACADAFASGAAILQGLSGLNPGDRADALRAFMLSYLSPEHCSALGTGCPTATLAADAARQGQAMQAAYADGVEGFLKALVPQVASDAADPGGPGGAREKAIDMLALLVGTIVLARGVGTANRPLSDEILAAARKRLEA